MDANVKKVKKSAIRINILAIFLIIIFCFLISPRTLQNDTFYTIKIGEYITENGVTMQEPFSWHENLEYTFPHWAYDVMIYKIFTIGGMTGIYISTIILASIFGIVMYLVNVNLNKNRSVSFILTIAVIYLMRNYIAARAQLVTFILFLLTIFFIEKFLENRKIRYAIGLIIIPILIANFHTATFWFYFVLYLPYIGEYMMYILSEWKGIVSEHKIKRLTKKNKNNEEKINKKIEELKIKNEKYTKISKERREHPYKITIEHNKNVKFLIIIMIICLFTGFLTPLGTTPYTYLIKTMQGISMDNISEHLPLTLIRNIDMICVLIFVFGILIFTDTKIRMCDLFMLGGLLYLTFSSQRQASMFVLAGVIIFNRMLSSMMRKYSPGLLEKLEELITTICGMIIVTCLVLIIGLHFFKKTVKNDYINERAYPVYASKWIKENLDLNEIKLYNLYNYGSYLIYEDIPVFIDSRCDLYMPEFNKDINVFYDFLKIDSIGFTDMEAKMNEYGFTHYLIKKNSKLEVYFRAKGPEYYQLIYPIEEVEDDVFCIYERK